jgi:hypothetical protein
MPRFEIGITQSEPGWLQILTQERVNYQVWDKTFTEQTPRVLIVNHPLTDEDTPAFKSWIEAGRGVVTDFPNLARLVHGFKFDRLETLHYIIPAEHPLFASVALVELELPGYCSNQANVGHLDNEGAALYAGNLGKGFVIALPFDVTQALSDERRGLKAFYWDAPELPYEEAAIVSKGAVRRLCVNCLREACRQVGVPYVHLWYYPEFKRTAFAFRVDGDFAHKPQIDATVELARRHGLKFSWYVNTKAQANLLDQFKTMAEQGDDIQFHCHEHKVFEDLEHNTANLEAGLQVMAKSGFKPKGAVGPFGHWNRNWDQALQQAGIAYASEFGLAHDDFPFFPILGTELSKVMQVPVHPMCFGRLMQAHLKGDALVAYYKRFFASRYHGGEPLFIYDHPHRIADDIPTFDAILKIVAKASDVWQTTLTDFYQWWVERARLEYEFFYEPDKFIVECGYEIATAVHVIQGDQEALLPLMTRESELDDLDWRPVKREYAYKPDMLRTQKVASHLKRRETMYKALSIFKK